MCGLQLDEPLKTRYKIIKFSNPAELKLIEFDELALRTEGEGFNFLNLFLHVWGACLVYSQEYYLKQHYLQKTNGENNKKRIGTDVKEIACIIMICILAQLFPAFERHINIYK